MDDLDKRLYEDYTRWKQWDAANDCYQGEVYLEEMDKIPSKNIKSILEIGFGYGHFMRWSKENGYDTEGIEISKDMLLKAQENGFAVYDSLSEVDKRYDLIVAFDVLEHISRDEVLSFLEDVKACLNPGGFFLARFPNGASPFGRIWQNGDLTHRLTLNCISASQLASVVDMNFIKCTNASRTLKSGEKGKYWFIKIFMYFFRDMIEFVLGYIYFGERVPFDPNLTVILQKK